MSGAFDFLLRHGYAVVFAAVLGEQLGLPVPAAPVLLAAGALAASGQLSVVPAILLGVAASLVGDLVWYELGRRRGLSILSLLCRISLEPDSCVRRTADVFARQGARALLAAKFVPGLSTAAPPLAGVFRMPLARFVVWDGAGALLWVLAYGGLGFVFSAQLEDFAAALSRFGTGLGLIVAAALAGYIGWKFFQRQRFLSRLRTARITPEELHRMLEVGGDVLVVDLRSAAEFEAERAKIPGALYLTPDELERRHQEIARDRDVVLYCS